MINIRVKSEGDPRVLAELIRSKLVREVKLQNVRTRPPPDEVETVNFRRIDPENDWTDL